eukprot:TRINITY_DN1105_c3_g1_i1.p1 TRINITY_DN1105_c3_g1~~TRINITY_DN1105_c3_g1_i1.p1  ORF type:complete len:313 (+),score=70.03 TRINITY_DN1105_c3_g1_i1:65-940(+)
MKIIDPHFHIWDISEGGYAEGCLFAPRGVKKYTIQKYEKDLEEAGLDLEGGVVVEAMSVCYKEKSAGEMNKGKCLEELEWTAGQVKNKPLKIVANCCLEEEGVGVERLLEKVKGFEQVVGFRQIVNFEPSYPRVHENFLKNKTFLKNLTRLEEIGFSFDLQLNPHQFQTAYEVFSNIPGLVVILNHIGSPTSSELASEESYWEPLTQLSTLPNLFVKISMLPSLDLEPVVKRLIDIFTPCRCMFATNHPVDEENGVELRDAYAAYQGFTAGYSEEDRDWLFRRTAMKAYKF